MEVSLIIQILINSLLGGSVFALGAIGLTLVFGVLDLPNLMHGEFLMLGGYAGWIFYRMGFHPYMAIIPVLVIFFLFGFILEKKLVYCTVGKSTESGLILMIGLSYIIANTILFIATPEPRAVPIYSGIIKIGNIIIPLSRLMAGIMAGIFIIILFFALYKTYIGKAIRAVAQQRNAASLMGINVPMIYAIVFGIGTATVGVAGVMLSTIIDATPTLGSYFTLLAFVIVILGGSKSPFGTLIAAFIIALVQQCTNFFLIPQFEDVMVYSFFLIFLLFRPGGLIDIK